MSAGRTPLCTPADLKHRIGHRELSLLCTKPGMAEKACQDATAFVASFLPDGCAVSDKMKRIAITTAVAHLRTMPDTPRKQRPWPHAIQQHKDDIGWLLKQQRRSDA